MTQHDVILNIGMRCADGAELTTPCIVRTIRQLGGYTDGWGIWNSETEPTFVAYVNGLSDDRIHTLSEALDQECIAVWDLMHREGRMIGPQAAKWGAFDPSQFILTNGVTLEREKTND